MGVDILASLARAAECVRNDEIDGALGLYEVVVGADSKNIDALLGCGKMWQKKGDFKNALNYYYKVLEVDPDNVVAGASVEMLNGIFNYYNKDMYNP